MIRKGSAYRMRIDPSDGGNSSSSKDSPGKNCPATYEVSGDATAASYPFAIAAVTGTESGREGIGERGERRERRERQERRERRERRRDRRERREKRRQRGETGETGQTGDSRERQGEGQTE
jgi:5-enolpyruvylshikimate-3-phosphate synthase